MPFVTDLVVRELDVNRWRVEEDLVYEGKRESLTVPTGTPTDFASVPALLRWFIPKYGRYNKSAVLHDHLCVESAAGRFSRADADGIFRRSMREVGVGYLRRRLMWVGVRWGGKLAGSDAGEAALVIGISILAFPFALLGLVAAQLLVLAYQLVELVVYVVRWLFKTLLRREAPQETAPKPTVYYKAA
ncbi:MAG: DUF1353 domain-containing protein [Actinomycetota bacterium]